MSIKKEKIQAVVDLFKPMTNELKLVFQKDGIHMWALDPGHVSMLFVILKKEACEEYDPSFSENDSGELEIVVDLDKLRDHLKLYKNKDMLLFTYDPEKNRLVAYNDNLMRTFGLIDPEGYPEFKLPALTLKKIVQLGTDQYLSTMERVMPKGEKKSFMRDISFSITSQGLIVKRYDENEGTENSEATIPKALIVAVTSDNDKRSVYGYEFLHPVVKAVKKYFPTITMEFDYNHPTRITGETEYLRVQYLLAPRIIQEDETTRAVPLEEVSEKQVSEPTTQEPEFKTEPVLETTEKTRVRENSEIGCFVILRTKARLIGEITEVTETGYMVLFHGMTSKTLKKPVEIDRDLVEVYKKD